MVRNAIFDFDGTLIDSYTEIAQTIKMALQMVGRKPIEIPRVIIGNPLRKMIHLLVPDMDDDEYRNFEGSFRSIYDSSNYSLTLPMPGADEIIHRCINVGIALHIVTMKPRLPTLRIMARMGWTKKFEVVVCSDSSASATFSKIGLLELALEQGDIEGRSACYIGDYSTDISAARGLGICSIAFNGGYGSLDALMAESPDAICSSLLELWDIFLGINNKGD